MICRYHKSHTGLSKYIKSVMVLENVTGHDAWPVLPVGVSALVCLSGKGHDGCKSIVNLWISGNLASMKAFPSCASFTVIAYLFQPFMSGVLFGIPIRRLKDSQVVLQDWNSGKAVQLQKEIENVEDGSRRMEVLDEFVRGQIQKHERSCEIIRISTDRMMCDPGKGVLSDIRKELGVTERCLQRLFNKYVGVTPNKFRRICQFHSSFQQVKSRQFASFTEVACRQGYADQSHFIRAFRKFTGRNPKAYMRYGLAKHRA